MKKRELINLGLEGKEQLALAKQATAAASVQGFSGSQIRERMQALVKAPSEFLADPIYRDLATILSGNRPKVKLNAAPIIYNQWGEDIDAEALEQMNNACRLPVSVAGALMPDAHVGYGLPIGGVLATENAVIPYAVGVDIACRMMVSVLDLEPRDLKRKREPLARTLEENTCFGIGGAWKNPPDHPVMNEDWSVSPVTAAYKDKAHEQLGTSGSGNHFVEFGEFDLLEDLPELKKGTYFAIVSHSGSRGTGAKVASYYSDLAAKNCEKLPSAVRHLAWLPMDEAGEEYWAAMELMGKYASANHHIIHKKLIKALGAERLFMVENHHNFAWKEKHFGRELIVHRKGATPAGAGVLGYIPGTMIAPGYLVRGLGNPASLNSAAHGAGRQMSRKKAKNTTTHHELKRRLSEAGVHLLSAGLDESPHAYKNIDSVMRAQSNLVKIVGRFDPKIVKMAPEGEKAED